ncbi:hypothetical protein [Acinetobacter haemolyticus]|uniref:Uncharacterized protein n=1 Tax=Acinetobacter haemolyticus TaxID=29430 RepID=A0AAW4J974_ACIHA|nr:hypothetical protein [Acinetobacter haemolyticus]
MLHFAKNLEQTSWQKQDRSSFHRSLNRMLTGSTYLYYHRNYK